nr:pilus assembly protein TadG-related protein [Mesobacterium pallidum]
MSIFAVFMFMIILIMGGIGIDMMRTELKRMKLQATLDRALLAAANLDQTLDPETVVRDYFAKAGVEGEITDVQVASGTTSRRVSATAEADVRSLFLQVLGRDSFEARVASVASERVNDVEISLVLDISGSMSEDKMTNLQDAAALFVAEMLTPNNRDRVSISLVPYSEHVNAGPLIMDQLDTTRLHDYSHCVEMPDSAFDETALDLSVRYEQAQHYQWNYYGTYADVRIPVCPMQAYERITPFSQDPVALTTQIRSFQPQAGTSIFLGMKWGAALLDPAFRPITASLAADNVVDGVFAGRPVAYPAEGEDQTTDKMVVLMTDGMNDYSNRIQPKNYATYQQRALWAELNLWHWFYNERGHDNSTILGVNDWDGVTESLAVDAGHGAAAAVAMDTIYDGLAAPSFFGNGAGSYRTQKYTPAQGDTLLRNICTAAKADGIVIWAIGFEVPQHSDTVMSGCASSPDHYFSVSGDEITDAFAAIARNINQLRLTQ